MYPYDFSMQQQTMADCYNSFEYSPAQSYYYGDNNYVWNCNSSLPSNSLFPANTYYSYIPGFSAQQQNNKCQTQPTAGTLTAEPIDQEKQQAEVVESSGLQQELEQAATFKLEQKYGRNIASNIFHNIIKRSLTQSHFEGIISLTISRHRMKITTSLFKQTLAEKTKTLRGYINVKTIRRLLIGRRIGATRLDIEFSKILRILCRVYVNNYHLPHVYHSVKIKRKSRDIHIKRMRKLLKMIL